MNNEVDLSYDQLRYLIMDYEISNSWFAGYCSADWLREIAAQYFAWKVDLKLGRYYGYKKVAKLFEKT